MKREIQNLRGESEQVILADMPDVERHNNLCWLTDRSLGQQEMELWTDRHTGRHFVHAWVTRVSKREVVADDWLETTEDEYVNACRALGAHDNTGERKSNSPESCPGTETGRAENNPRH